MKCSYFENNQCRSCSLLESGEQNAFLKKTSRSRKLLEDFLDQGIEDDGFFLPTASQSRNKAKLIAGGTFTNPIFGISSSNMQVIELERCPLHVNILNEAIHELKNLITKNGIYIYNPKSQKGELKAVILAVNNSHSELMVRLVLRSTDQFERAKNILDQLTQIIPKVSVTSVNIQPIAHAILEGQEEIITSDKKFLSENINDISLFYPPKSFMQVNLEVAKNLYSTASSWLKAFSLNSLLDLYCGNGAFALHMAKDFNKVVGYELSNESITAAKLASQKNNFTNTNFVSMDVDSVVDAQSEDFDCIIVNPPRRGLSENTIKFINGKLPKVLLYSSCNPVTLARDLGELTKFYKVKKIKFFDMFPLTEHLETLVLLQVKA